MTTNVPDRLVRGMRDYDRFLIVSHIHPDGDAIGSSLGLARLVANLGKSAQVWLRDPPPSIYRPLPAAETIHLGSEAPDGFPQRFDRLIVLECPTPERTGFAKALQEIPVFNIDHHLGNEQYGEIDWIDTSAAAVGALVYRLARRLEAPIDPETATLLYLALVTDTGGFRFSNTSADAFELAASLVRAGACPETVSRWLHESQPAAFIRLVGETLNTLELHAGGRLATVWLDRDMVERAGAQDGDSEGLIDFPRSIAGVDAVALMRQIDERHYKVSLRSRGAIDVEQVARRFGGGGHPNAAGFTLQGAQETLFHQTLEALTRALEGATAHGPAPEQRPSDRQTIPSDRHDA